MTKALQSLVINEEASLNHGYFFLDPSGPVRCSALHESIEMDRIVPTAVSIKSQDPSPIDFEDELEYVLFLLVSAKGFPQLLDIVPRINVVHFEWQLNCDSLQRGDRLLKDLSVMRNGF
jgi:hypothetical protein